MFGSHWAWEWQYHAANGIVENRMSIFFRQSVLWHSKLTNDRSDTMCAFPHQVSRPLEHLWDSKGHPPVNHSCYRLAEDVQVLSGSGNARYDYDLFIGMVGFFFSTGRLRCIIIWHCSSFLPYYKLSIWPQARDQSLLTRYTHIQTHAQAQAASANFFTCEASGAWWLIWTWKIEKFAWF